MAKDAKKQVMFASLAFYHLPAKLLTWVRRCLIPVSPCSNLFGFPASWFSNEKVETECNKIQQKYEEQNPPPTKKKRTAR